MRHGLPGRGRHHIEGPGGVPASPGPSCCSATLLDRTTKPVITVTQNWSAERTSPPARVERKLKIRGSTVSLMNRTDPSQNRKLQPPGCRLQKSSATAAL